MRILVIGGSGLIGSHIYSSAKVRCHEVIATYRNFPVEGLERLDLADESSTRSLFNSFQPDWVVHSSGFTWADGCESDPERAFRENCEQPSMLARICSERDCRFAYFSSTYVFDGAAGPYSETDKPNPINAYGRSKWAAENEIQDILEGKALIPRVICVWGREVQRKNFVYQAISALREGRPLRLPSDQIGNPTWAGDIAWWLTTLMERGQSSVWNLAGSEQDCSRVHWFCQIRDSARKLGLAPEALDKGFIDLPTSTLGQTALRPLHAGALTAKIMSYEPHIARMPSELDLLSESFARCL